MHLRHPTQLLNPPKNSPQEQHNPDSSSKIDVTEIDDDSKCLDVDDNDDDNTISKNIENRKITSKEEGVNLTVYKGRKAAVTLVRQKDEVSSSDCKNSRTSSNNNNINNNNNRQQSDVWRPY